MTVASDGAIEVTATLAQPAVPAGTVKANDDAVFAFEDQANAPLPGDDYYLKDAEGQFFAATAEIRDNGAALDTADVSAAGLNVLDDMDTALNQVDKLRSEDAITNLAAARSRIEDADYAVEVANMTRAQILQQAGTSVLAQANQIPQSVLSLLG